MFNQPRIKPSTAFSISPFDVQDEDPLGPMANLVDVILVFACGLIAALVALSPDLQKKFDTQTITKHIELGEELLETPETLQKQNINGQGMEAIGQVYRDSKTGKLILLSD